MSRFDKTRKFIPLFCTIHESYRQESRGEGEGPDPNLLRDEQLLPDLPQADGPHGGPGEL